MSDAELVARAVRGDRDALEEVVRAVQDPVYRLALRMTGLPADAEDATQEILIRVVTRLASWRGEAALVTWAYRIGVNHLLDRARTSALERARLTFDGLGAELAGAATAPEYDGPDAGLLAEEVRLRCTQAMLQCLDRDDRAVFVIGEVFALPGEEAAWVFGTTAAAYRKRLERARRRIRSFMEGHCGLVNAAAGCRCARRASVQVARGRLDPAGPRLALHPVTRDAVRGAAGQMHELHDAATVLRSHPAYAAPRARTEAVLGLLASGRFPLAGGVPGAEVGERGVRSVRDP